MVLYVKLVPSFFYHFISKRSINTVHRRTSRKWVVQTAAEIVIPKYPVKRKTFLFGIWLGSGWMVMQADSH